MKARKFLLCSSVFLANLAFANEALKTDNVIISATGFEQDADNNLRNVIVIQGADIQDKGYTSIEDALQRVAGVSFVSVGINGDVGRNIDIRGQGASANSAVKVMVDSIPINILDNDRLHSSGVSFSPLDVIAIEDIERIEIIPGGGAVLYGNGTRGGAINIITKKNKDSQASISLRENVFDSGRNATDVNLNFSNKINDTLAFSNFFKIFNEEGYRDGDKAKGFYQNSKLFITLNDRADLSLGFAYYKSDDDFTGPLSKEQIDSDPTQKTSDDNTFKITRPEFNADLNYLISDNFKINAQAFWQKQEVKITDTQSWIYQSGSFSKDSIKGANIKGKFDYLPNSYLVFGYNFEQHDAKFASQSVIGTTNSKDEKETHSIFVLDSHEFNSMFSLSGGLRYEFADYTHHRLPPSVPQSLDTDTDNFALELTPNLRYSDTGRVYVKYERGFISPTPYQFRYSERVTNPNGISTTIYGFNNDLESETYDTYEIGMSDYLFGFYGIDLAVFYTKTNDEIHRYNPRNASNTGYMNIDKTNRYGVELNLRQDFDKLSFTESLAYVNAKIASGLNDGKLIPYVSKVKATGSANYAWTNYFSTFVNLTYQSRSKDEGTTDPNFGTGGQINKMINNSWIKEIFITDIGATYQHKALSVFAGVKNLFDYEYYTYQNAYDDEYSPGNGRSYYVEFKYKF